MSDALKLRSYPWYVEDWLNSETRAQFTLEQRGLYRDLLDLCWRHGSLPGDPRILAQLVHLRGRSDRLVVQKRFTSVIAKFPLHPDGRRHHPKVDENRKRLEELVLLRQSAGKKGGLRTRQRQASAQASAEAGGSKCYSFAAPNTITVTTSASIPASPSSVASLPSEGFAEMEKHTSTGKERETFSRAREENHSREKSNLALVPSAPWLDDLMAQMADLYSQAGLPIAPKQDQLIRQYIVGLDEPARARVPERLPNYCMWALATGRWKSPATTKSLLNVLREGDWDVPLTPRTLPDGEALRRKPNQLEEQERRFIERMRAKAQKGTA